MENKDVEAFDLELENRHIEGLWKLYATPPRNEPPAALKPHVWKWSQIQQDLERAGEIVDLAGC
jgi:gentisate 1,2-dioxygenase